MRRTALVLVSLLIFASNAYAKEVWLSVVGSVTGSSVFRTDTRILNPSTTKDISIDAYLLVNGNQTNANPQKQHHRSHSRGWLRPFRTPCNAAF